MKRAPIDEAALLLLRPLLDDLQGGRVLVTTLQAGDDRDCSIALAWRLVEPEVAAHDPTWASAPVPADEVAEVAAAARAAGPHCPACGSSRLVETNTGHTCAECCRDV